MGEKEAGQSSESQKGEKHGEGARGREWEMAGTLGRKGRGLTTLPALINPIKVLKIRSHGKLLT